MDVPATFGELVAGLDYAMFIVTVRAGDEWAGCLVGVANSSEALAVHFVPRQAKELADLFGGRSGDEVDKFARCAWQPGPGGLPILRDCGNWFVGRVLERLDLGDHVGFLLEPVAAHREDSLAHFEFHQAKTIAPGHPA